jgi:TRAP-type mannitol/chloroaromatic compound transport system substrate-binding protein
MREFYAKYNIVNFLGGNTGAQMGGWFRKEVKSLADLKGLKFRVGGFAGRVIERLGGVAQNIPAGEIYSALEKGTIDAAEWIGPYDDMRLGLNKVAPFYYYPGWWEGSLNLEFYVNTKALATLTSEQRAIVQAASHEAHVVTQARYDARNPGALKQLVTAKVKVLPFPQSVMDAAFKETMALYVELGLKNSDWRKIYTDYRIFQRDQILWFRFAESRFDSFMAAQKL